MGKQPVRLKAVVYSLSPFQQKTMSGLWNDLPGKIHHKISDHWIGVSLLLAPLVGVYTFLDHWFYYYARGTSLKVALDRYHCRHMFKELLVYRGSVMAAFHAVMDSCCFKCYCYR